MAKCLECGKWYILKCHYCEKRKTDKCSFCNSKKVKKEEHSPDKRHKWKKWYSVMCLEEGCPIGRLNLANYQLRR